MRLFVAVEIPEPHRRSVERAIQPLRLSLRGAVRWVPRESWHATLKFLGEVPDARVPEASSIIGRTASATAPTVTSLTAVGAFPSMTRARVLWVGLDDPGGRLAELAAALEEALGAAGFRQESRPLRLHLTLARIRVPLDIAAAVDKGRPYTFEPEPFPVDDAVLFRSILGRGGAVYEETARFPFGEPSGP